MTDAEIELATVRLAGARTTLKQAEDSAKRGDWHICANRLYYACFYGASALFILDGIGTSKHKAVLTFLAKDYVKTGLLHTDHGTLMQNAFTVRCDADYAPEKPIPSDKLVQWLRDADQFLDDIEKLISLRTSRETNN